MRPTRVFAGDQGVPEECILKEEDARENDQRGARDAD
jgi:hypothetical protein